MAKIFISYRRVDSGGYVGRIYDHLLKHFKADDVFRDLDAIKPGEDFVKIIGKVLDMCDAVVAVIGPQWLDIRDDTGNRRIDNPEDYVRMEIAASLNRNKLVIPVLVGQAEMPKQYELPIDLSGISRRNAIEISDDRFTYDVNRLLQAIGGDGGQLVVRVSFMDNGTIILYDGRKKLTDIHLSPVITINPVAIQLERGTHVIHARYITLKYWISSNWNSTQEQRSNVLRVDLKSGQAQNITIEREMISPAQYETVRLPLDKKNQYFDWNKEVTPPQYKIVLKPY